MAIKMQGTWLVRVKALNAAYPQEFVITGATSGNGTYPGTHPDEVFVTGASWSVSIRNNPGTGFLPSKMKLKFPTTSGGFRQFDIQSNDAGGDQDFDDLIITCRTPVAANDHLIYGHVSDYSGPCIANPCFPYWVIDTPFKLREALRIPELRKHLLQWDPNLIRRIPLPWPPDPIGPVAYSDRPYTKARFVPVTIPVPGELATPLKEQFLVRTTEKTVEFAAETAKKAAKQGAISERFTYQAIKSQEAWKPTTLSLDVKAYNQKKDISAALAKFRFCDADALANVRIRFWEYDRTEAEKSGGAYSGEGERQYLGSTHTDDFGNYIFRFTTSTSDAIDEVLTDLAPGEDAYIAQAPDVVAEVMQPLDPFMPAFETAAYWNVPAMKRINICVPREKIGVRQQPCNGLHIIQFIGDIPLSAPVGGVRSSVLSSLDYNGIISYNTNNFGANCAAWKGVLRIHACLSNPAIKYYTLQHRAFGEANWQSLDINFTSPGFNGISYFNGQVNQGIVNGMPIYLNVDHASGGWYPNNIRAQFDTRIFPQNGPQEIRIIGLDSAYQPVPNVDESVTLFIMNNGIDVDIKPEIEMSGYGRITECGLFTLPAGVDNPAIQVNFKAIQSNVPPVFNGYGFMEAYAVGMLKGASGTFPTSSAGTTNPRTAAACDLYFHGTNDDPTNVDGYVDLQLTPASGGWLEPGQTFCTFAVTLVGRLRCTDGHGMEPNSSAIPVLFGIQR